jgi:hypothetical protein
MSRKRGRGEDEVDARARAPVKVEEVTRAVMRIVSAWRDACGSEYQVRARLETSQDASALRIGSFDELACNRIVAVLDADLPGDYSITESQCDMTKKGLILVIRRSWAGGATAAKEARTDGEAAVGAVTGSGGGVSSEFVRLRISNIIVEKADADSVVAAMNSVMKHLPSGTTWTVSSSPACHVVSFKLTDAKLSTAAVRAACVASASGSASAVDFERGVLRVSVPKAHPEIL